MEFRTFKIRHDRKCPVCGDNRPSKRPSITSSLRRADSRSQKSLAETEAEVKLAKQTCRRRKEDANLDDRGLPPGI